jgi:ComF family protein
MAVPRPASLVHTFRLDALPRLGGALATLALDVLVPRRCGLCGAFGEFLCPACTAALPRADGPRCRTCAAPLAPGALCRACAALPEQPLASLTAACCFADGARRLVHRLKYESLSALAEPMGALMAACPLPHPGPDVIAPVPLHRGRRRQRGFNQAELLARVIARAHGVPVAPRALVRVRATPSQVRQASAGRRAANVAGAFACREDLSGRVVLLVDDVATTGATLRACATVLRAAGAVAVHALVFAHDD